MPTTTNQKTIMFAAASRNWNDTKASPQPPPPWNRSYVNDVRIDSVTKAGPVENYKWKIRNARSATSSLSGEKWGIAKPPNGGYAYFQKINSGTGTRQHYERSGDWCTTLRWIPSDPSSISMSHVRNKVIQDINAQIRDGQTALQGLVSLGEMGETVRMINNAGKGMFSGLFGTMGDIRSNIARFASPRNFLRYCSEKWLGYHLGVKPLIADVEAGLKGLSRMRDFRQPIVKLRASSHDTTLDAQDRGEFNVSGWLVDVVRERRSTYSYRLYGALGLANNGLDSINTEFGFTTSEFLPTLWELIPYSFLADYFVNIGAVIDALSINKSGLRWLAYGDSRQSTAVTRAADIRFSNPADPPWICTADVRNLGNPIEYTRRKVLRGVFDSALLVPSLEFTIPGSSTRWCNIGALLALHSGVAAQARRKFNR